MKSKTLKIPIFFGSLKVIKTNNVKRIEKKYNLLKEARDCPAFVFRTGKPDKLKIIAVFTKGCDLSIVAHETVHVVNMIMEYDGIDLDPKNDETQAYLTGWVFGKINSVVKFGK